MENGRFICFCNIVGTKTVIMSILLLTSGAFLAAALGYPWVKLGLFQSTGCACTCSAFPCTSECCKTTTVLYLGLFAITEHNLTATGNRKNVEINTLDLKSSTTPLEVSALPVVIAASLASGAASIASVCFASVVACPARRRLQRCSVMAVNISCLISSLCAATGLAAFLDFYIWQLRDGIHIIPLRYMDASNGLPSIHLASLDWAFYLHVSGVFCAAIALAVSCRSAVKIALRIEDAQAPQQIFEAAKTSTSKASTVAVYDKNLGKWIMMERRPPITDK